MTVDSQSGRSEHVPKVLVVIGTYLPGVRGGGHIQSVAALSQHLAGKAQFYIVCQDRDEGDDRPYPGIPIGDWTTQGNSSVLYLSASQFTLRRICSSIRAVQPDVVYLNTLFSVRETLLPLLACRLLRSSATVVLAPRGCLDPGALSLKSAKKAVFIRLVRLSGVTRGVVWQASTEMESTYIVDAMGSVEVAVASNLVPLVSLPRSAPPAKESGRLRLVFYSRVSPKKNLLYLIERLRAVKGSVELTVAGPLEDERYWSRCRASLDHPGLTHVTWHSTGPIYRSEVADLLAGHDLFALPTLGENFGHVVIEALTAGTPVLLSDRTPWKGIEDLGAGWEVSLDDPVRWETALQAACDADDRTWSSRRTAACSARHKLFNQEAAIEQNLALFGAVIRSGS